MGGLSSSWLEPKEKENDDDRAGLLLWWTIINPIVFSQHRMVSSRRLRRVGYLELEVESNVGLKMHACLYYAF